jgi:hypothetical protein
MNHRQCLFYLLLFILPGFLSCGENAAPAAVSPATASTATATAGTDTAPRKRHPDLMRGKGSLSFKLDGKLYATDPLHTKCWTSANIPLVMLMATGEGLNISWQMGYNSRQDEYRLDSDKKGTLNFTIDGKMYWTRSVLHDDYLDIHFTEVKDKYSVKMLSGTFEGVLEDKDGHKVHITEGKFVTEDI